MLYLYQVATQHHGFGTTTTPPPPPPEVGGGSRKKRRKPWHGGLVHLERLLAEQQELEQKTLRASKPFDDEEEVLLLYLLD